VRGGLSGRAGDGGVSLPDPKAVDVALDVLDKLANGADKAAEAAAHLVGAVGGAVSRAVPEAWNILVNQQIANGVVGLFRWLLGWATVYLLIRAARAATVEHGSFTRENGPTRATWLTAAYMLMFCAQVVLGYLEVPLSIKQIINPRYYAAAELIQLARTMR
jgi:hypothetical protein